MKTDKSRNILLIVVPLLLIIIGITTLASISDIAPPAHIHGMKKIKYVLQSFPVKQGISAVIAFAVFFIISKIDYFRLRNSAYLFYSISLAILFVLYFYGKVSHGSRRWIPLGFFNFQPSELMKICFIFALARFLMYKSNLSRIRGLIVPFMMTLVPMLLVVIQPDLGTSLIFFPILMAMLFIAGAKPSYLLLTIACIALSTPLAYKYVLKDYQRMRLIAFLSPESPEFRMYEGYQLSQSKMAISSGGLLGKGAGNAVKGLVPEQHNDFIFSTIGEEWGFLGAIVVVFLYILLLIQCAFMAYKTREPFGRLVIIGVITYILVQTSINVGMTVGLAPITGLTLPFISYGGSSLLVSLFALGVVYNIGNELKPSFSSRDVESDEVELFLPVGISRKN